MTAPLRIVRIADPIPALELVRPDGHGWLLMPLPRTRLRLRFTDWPEPHLRLVDSPRPGCLDCEGVGELETGGDEDGPFDPAACRCWDPWLVVAAWRLPRWVARRLFGWREATWSTEPPF